MSTGTRGKYAEAKVRDVLKKLSEDARTMFMRLPDARAGSFTPTTADFLVTHYGKTIFVEVKEVAHDYLLPHKNFSPDQRARIKRWTLAGAKATVIVYHSTSKLWRLADLRVFDAHEGASWNLFDLPTCTTKELEGRLDTWLALA